jgi:hypothetical protein
MFHAACVPLEAMHMLSEAFPDTMDYNGLIPGDTVKWFTLYDKEGENRKLGLST